MSKIYLEILDRRRLKVFEKLAVFKRIGTLAGGTAIALQIKHRKSFDLDVFIKNQITKGLHQKIREVLGYSLQIIKDETNQIDIITPELVKVTFVKHSYPALYPLVPTGSIGLFDLRDLASNKAFTIGSRGVWRDYVDLFFLLKEGFVTLSSVIKDAAKRFGGEFNQRLFLEQLIYTKDIQDFGIDYIGKEFTTQEIVDYLSKLIRDYAKAKIIE